MGISRHANPNFTCKRLELETFRSTNRASLPSSRIESGSSHVDLDATQEE